MASPRPFPLYDKTQSIARTWNEITLALISRDYARPTVHARNLFHSSTMMYDIWTVFDRDAKPYFLGAERNSLACPFTEEQKTLFQKTFAGKFNEARNEAISHAMYRLLAHRFAQSPDFEETIVTVQNLFKGMAKALHFSAVLYESMPNEAIALESMTAESMARQPIVERVDPAALGRYVADCVIRYGLSDGSNEKNGYANSGYYPANEAFNPDFAGISGIHDPNRWQPLNLVNMLDQAGFEVDTPEFIGANWGRVIPFALQRGNLQYFKRSGVEYPVYHDPGPPPLIDSNRSDFKWNHLFVAKWSAHLDPFDGVMWDISPGTQGKTAALPSVKELGQFYLESGLIPQRGHKLNPSTGEPYKAQIVPRGDYTRVLAEFWADGPHSETPPGHWFSIMNTMVHDHPDFARRYRGVGKQVDRLEWDVKAYFTLGAAMHDAAIAAWSIKGWYDYARPLSTIRYLASLGQSTDKALDNYHPDGIPLEKGFAELVNEDDPAHLTGYDKENVGKIKLYVWRGPPFVRGAQKGIAGVGWLLAEQWWPYQKPTFVTPPFAGYVSGHSTFSRAAADVLHLLTGDQYFPGGMGQYKVKANQFLTFEAGPSVDVVLQWATYKDASDQTSLSRIWGGIHPPIDDIPGRRIGAIVGLQAFEKARQYFDGRGIDEGQRANSILRRANFYQYTPIRVLLFIIVCCIFLYVLGGFAKKVRRYPKK